jgi:hypothetical protein
MIQVIGAGFGRTGTSSLKVALEELGFGPCYHMTEVIRHPEHVAMWKAAAEQGSVDWATLFREYQSTLDWPGCTFYPALMAAYPEAKVILTVRDPERWYESTANTIYTVRTAFPAWAKFLVPRMARFSQMVETLVWHKTFHDRFADRAYAIEVYNQHNAEVIRTVPADRLLVFDVKEGWEPLCRFLGVAVPPDQPFPHHNDTAGFLARIERIRQAQQLVMVLVGVGLLAVGFWLWRRR